MLTDYMIATFRPKAKPYTCADGCGLLLLMTPIGSKLWRFSYRFDGKQHTIAGESYPEVSNVLARAWRDAMRQQLASAIAECTQGFANRLSPLTMCEYDVSCEPLGDLRTEVGRQELGVSLADLACGWLTSMRAGADAPSWVVADRFRGEGYAGILVPSFAASSGLTNHNLVLWNWGFDLPTRVVLYDPDGRLPADQSSWTKAQR
ncbi:integrase arm-type DNA-binding domain-containing protein [Sphingopyxis flava]|uniref:Integrase DNA-binding domain-containing protein n=1 Tax=Sphingopyxis flava TaxID=1507287 RepID=A0A1T5F8B9_9SPHN|nr:integrase arm-type DNA-binding domain-containing protein [Sphingopyxis flava]SKB92406.1 protein of unknown function [Sphingopyxis flava]